MKWQPVTPRWQLLQYWCIQLPEGAPSEASLDRIERRGKALCWWSGYPRWRGEVWRHEGIDHCIRYPI